MFVQATNKLSYIYFDRLLSSQHSGKKLQEQNQKQSIISSILGNKYFRNLIDVGFCQYIFCISDGDFWEYHSQFPRIMELLINVKSEKNSYSENDMYPKLILSNREKEVQSVIFVDHYFPMLQTRKTRQTDSKQEKRKEVSKLYFTVL